MSEYRPHTAQLKLIQSPGPLRTAALARLDHLIILLPPRPTQAIWRKLPDGRRLGALARRAPPGQLIQSRIGNARGTGITLGRLPEAPAGKGVLSAFTLLKFAGEMMAAALKDKPRSLGILVAGLEQPAAADAARSLTLAAGAHSFRLPVYKSRPDRNPGLKTLRLYGLERRLDPARTLAEIESGNLVRWLTRLPPNKLDAKQYRQVVQALARENKWQMTFLNEAELRRRGAGAFLAVAQGNADRDAGIIHLRYRPGRARHPLLALVGKGIIFDTGGTNLKPFKSMLDMHEDMAGSAVALATLLALSRLNFDYPVDCWLAVTENRLSNKAYKSRDVVTASNGTTIEVIHTDAEGRMALADALALAGREKPGMIIDYATLTGTCISALTDRYSGVFTNRQELNPVLTDAGQASGERVWPFPMDDDYEESLKSEVADILQCSAEGGGDHILAARFLQRFVPADCAWVHVDLSAVARREGLAQVPPGPTGFGVRFTLNLLTEQGPRLETLIGKAAGEHSDRE